MVELSVDLCGAILQNPVMAASGVFGYGHEFAPVFDINTLGGFSFKGTTIEPRFGNNTPRIAECDSGMLNSVGLQNPGVYAVTHSELPQLAKVFSQPVAANISGFEISEFATLAAVFDKEPSVAIIEVNISCPNVHGGGLSFGTDPTAAAAVTNAVRKSTSKPVFVKLSPNTADICTVAKACETAGADGICLINTLLGMRLHHQTGKPILANIKGGLSGGAVFPIALRMVYEVACATHLPIIGVGGIDSAQKVIEMMSAGATAIQIGAAFLRNPNIFCEILQDLPDELKQIGCSDINQIIGRAYR